jgi:hypothetical protein
MEAAIQSKPSFTTADLSGAPNIAVGRANATEAFVGLLKEQNFCTQRVKFI